MVKITSVLKNLSYTLSSNFISLCVSIIVSLLLPKILGFVGYGYYQLYIFYVSYVGMLHLGWCDGIYLRYGGYKYHSLDKKKITGQFYSLLIFQTMVTVLFITLIYLTNQEGVDKKIVLYSASLNIIILNLRTFYILILQTTNRMREYSLILLVDRIIYILAVMLLIILKVKIVSLYILVDLVAKLISLIFAINKCSDISSIKNIEFDVVETKLNIFSGINLMLANIASMLIIGIVRFGIQDKWDVETFGKISLTLSISNMLMIFVGAVSLAIFPIIKRSKEENYSFIYPQIRTIIMPFVLIMLVFYFPAELLLGKWLPQFQESLKFMVLVFPMVIFESKVSLLTNTFLKALRKENVIFKINFITALCSVGLTILFVYVLENLFLSMLSIVILLGIRSTLSEIMLKKYLSINLFTDIFLEFILVFIFIYFGWTQSKYVGLLIYIVSLVLYLFFKKKNITKVVKSLKN